MSSASAFRASRRSRAAMAVTCTSRHVALGRVGWRRRIVDIEHDGAAARDLGIAERRETLSDTLPRPRTARGHRLAASNFFIARRTAPQPWRPEEPQAAQRRRQTRVSVLYAAVCSRRCRATDASLVSVGCSMTALVSGSGVGAERSAACDRPAQSRLGAPRHGFPGSPAAAGTPCDQPATSSPERLLIDRGFDLVLGPFEVALNSRSARSRRGTNRPARQPPRH